jgi:hypothetical protein
MSSTGYTGAPLPAGPKGTSSVRAVSQRLAILVTVIAAMSGSARAGGVCSAVADVARGQVWRREGRCEQRVTPASTFKIAISLMDTNQPSAPPQELVDGHRLRVQAGSRSGDMRRSAKGAEENV